MKMRILTCTLILLPAAVSAATLNLRHEFAPERSGDEHRDRIYVSHRFDNNVGFSVEAKWGYKEGHLTNSGHETGLNYRHQISEQFTLTPGIQLDSGSSATTYKYNLAGAYKISDTWDVAARIRHGYKNSDNSRYNQVNLYANRHFEWGKVGVDMEYKDLNSDEGGWNNQGHDQLLSFSGEYTKLESGWIPFVEIAAITNTSEGSEHKDEYIARYRAGLKLNF